MVNYINTAPIYEIWKEQVHEADWQVIEAPPAGLNRMLAADKLDMRLDPNVTGYWMISPFPPPVRLVRFFCFHVLPRKNLMAGPY